MMMYVGGEAVPGGGEVGGGEGALTTREKAARGRLSPLSVRIE